ncbi:MAG: DUF2914 domain-containing protein [Polyangiaceae bacterium]
MLQNTSLFVGSKSFTKVSVVLALALSFASGCGKARPTGESAPTTHESAGAAQTSQVQAPSPVTPANAPPADRPVLVAADPPAAPEKTEKARPAAERPRGDGHALKVKKLVLATSIDKSARAPRGVATTFEKGKFERLFAYVEVENKDDPAEIFVRFERPSYKPARGLVHLDVGHSKRWRTWASSRVIDEVGKWEVVVTTADGRELAREVFEITEPAPASAPST